HLGRGRWRLSFVGVVERSGQWVGDRLPVLARKTPGRLRDRAALGSRRSPAVRARVDTGHISSIRPTWTRGATVTGLLLFSMADRRQPRTGSSQPMPKPCPRCGLENTHEATHCSRCDAPLRDAATISPAFRRLLLALGGFALITTIGVAALVYVQQTAVPLGDPVVPAMDSAARDEAFAREQALEAPPPATAGGRAPSATGMAPDAASQAAPTPAPG